jgi:hypothetical protein
LQDKIEDSDYAEQQALIQLHWGTDQYESEDFFRMGEVLAARKPEDRPQDPLDFLSN